MTEKKTLKQAEQAKPLTQTEKFERLKSLNNNLALLASEFELVLQL
jgi:hypothetical protein